jgi:tetratricopeptide (TPR) repeat protein
MNEKMILELLAYIQSHKVEFSVIQTKLELCRQAIEWAKQVQRWDLVIEFTEILTYHFIYSIDEDSPEIDNSFWEQGRSFAKEGLLATQQVKNQDKELGFLMDLAQLSGYLQDFKMAINYLEQASNLVTPNRKGYIAREFYLLGNRAGNLAKDFLTARICYQASLDIFQELDNNPAMADVLAFMGVNEEKQNNFDLAKQLFDRSNELRTQLNKDK